MSATNSYILYRRIHSENLNDSSDVSAKDKKLLNLPQFREEIAAGLLLYNEKRSVGRPSSRPTTPRPTTPVENLVPELRRGMKAVHPVDETRFDLDNHFGIWLDSKGRRACKHCKTSKTQHFCEKCNIHLCSAPGKNCFYEYHHRQST